MGLKVLIVASEVSPYAKSGGLGDVTGSLPKALLKEGVDVRVVFPKYKNIKENYTESAEYIGSFVVNLGWRNQGTSIFKLDCEVPTYMLSNDYYFGRDGYYGYGDDNERFAYFCKASIEFLDVIDFIPDVIHCNDWQAAPICVYLKDVYSKLTCFSKIKTLFTIHNLQYQGIFPKETLGMMDLNDGYFVNDKLEFNNMVCFMKAGILYSDAITTVSKTYAYEVQRPEYGYGLDGTLRCRSQFLTGIVNGIDYEENDPKTSEKLFVNFDVDNLEGKKENKRKLQEQLGLPQKDVPMISIISRLVDQKGVSLLIENMYELVSKDVQIVILGTGDGKYEYLFKEFGYRYPDKVSANIMFNETLAQRIYAASDIFLMPSLFEPCGLGQIFAMSYGTVPIARMTGGLVDTVQHFNWDTEEGNGFMFQDFISSGLMWAINEALIVYNNPEKWEKVVKNAFNTRFSWENSAKEYIALYEKLKNE